MLEEIRDWTICRAREEGLIPTTIRGIFHVDLLFSPGANERRFRDGVLVAQTQSQGACCFMDPSFRLDPLLHHMERGYRGERLPCRWLDVALLDSLAASLRCEPTEAFDLIGPVSHKSRERAIIIANEIGRYLSASNPRRTVGLVGYVSAIALELDRRGYHVAVTDLDFDPRERVVPRRARFLSGGLDELRKVRPDLLLATGMTVANDTLGQVRALAVALNVPLVIYAETGSGFAKFYTENGVHSVVAEPFPFYIFDGHTAISVYRAKSGSAFAL